METEMHSIGKLMPIRFGGRSNNIREQNVMNDYDHKYTSLRDVISPHSICSTYNHVYGNGFDSSNIAIRNQLVKQAASAYLQSAAILTYKNQNWMVRFWRTVNNKAALRMWWRNYVMKPLQGCARRVFRFFAHVVGQIGCVWDGGSIA